MGSFRKESLPIFHPRTVDISHHHLTLGSIPVGVDINLVTVGIHRTALILHIVGHLNKLRTGHAKVTHIEVVAGILTTLRQEHHRLFLIHVNTIKTLGMSRILIEEHILSLRSTHPVVIYLMAFVHIGELLAFHRGIIGRIIKAVTLPGGPGELCPFDMVGKQLTRLGIHYIKLLPITATSRNGIGRIFPVVREPYALECHRTVIGKAVRVKEYTLCSSQLIHHVKHTLVLQTVVLIDIPAPMSFERCAYLLIIAYFLQSLQQFSAERNLLQIGISNLILSLHPLGCCRRGVVFQPTIRVGYFHPEILINSIVFRCNGIIYLCLSGKN